MRPIVWFWIALSLLAPPVFGWGNAGHQVVCEIAFQQMGPEARALVSRLRRNDPARTSFAESCIWPDEVRKTTHKDTYEYHFINLKEPANGLDLARDCEALDCVSVAIQRYAVYLRDYAESGKQEKRAVEALKFLGHFVGDLHQPLHVGRAVDLGGNEIHVTWAPTGNSVTLHSVWDTWIPSWSGIVSSRSAPALLAELDPTAAAAWKTTNPGTWAQESWTLARDVAYTVADGDEITEDYIEAASPKVREQLLKAGVRLAHLLDLAASGTLEIEH
jgi:hypothetical protein